MGEWRDISTAPKDGTEIVLTWMEDGKPQEQWPMRWEPNEGNPLVQSSIGIWAMRDRNTGRIYCTWSEKMPDGSPTHWMPAS